MDERNFSLNSCLIERNMPFSLDIIIVNWNTGNQLQGCLELNCRRRIGIRIFELKRVVVVDNASTDGSADNLVSAVFP